MQFSSGREKNNSGNDDDDCQSDVPILPSLPESGSIGIEQSNLEVDHVGSASDMENEEFQPLVVTNNLEPPSMKRRVYLKGVSASCHEQMSNCCKQTMIIQRNVVRSTITVMAFLARVLFWVSLIATSVGVFWYSRELSRHGTDAHLIAWFSAGAFVILGFPISIYGIIQHLSNYYQPNVQCYVVRILWMVPLYSIGSWLCLRYHQYAIYIETVRDFYESFVLYCFLHFLIESLGGEESLILMLKDKSPTRGAHMWGLQWCMRPWIMGQPVSRMVVNSSSTKNKVAVNTGSKMAHSNPAQKTSSPRFIKRVQWTSPFFVRCKVGVLQYVLLKFVCALLVFALEIHGLYKEGDFTYKGGYLYICIVTNISQCWALYCMIFFYYATKNELGPIRPVGKFLSVKAIVFFTWWQSLFISILFEMGMFHHYKIGNHSESASMMNDPLEGSGDVMWSPEDVAKGLQDYLICIEMFIAAIVHQFVFPHAEYINTPFKGGSKNDYNQHLNSKRIVGRKGRLNRRYANYAKGSATATNQNSDDFSHESKTSAVKSDFDIEMNDFMHADHQIVEVESQDTTVSDTMASVGTRLAANLSNIISGRGEFLVSSKDETYIHESTNNDLSQQQVLSKSEEEEQVKTAGTKNLRLDMTEDGKRSHIDSTVNNLEIAKNEHDKTQQRTGFVRALIDSTVPNDIMDNTVGLARGDFRVQKRTLLHHAATSDEYDLFSKNRRRIKASTKPKSSKSANSSIE